MLYLILASLLWSLSFALVKQSGIDADLLSAARLGLAALVFLPVLLRARSLRRAGPLVGIGALQFGVMYVLVMRSYAFLEGHEVALLTITTPVLVVLTESLLARRLVGRALAASAIAVLAALALRRGALDAVAGGGGLDGRFLTGLLLVQGANLAWAIGQVLYRRFEPAEADRSARSGAAARFGWLYVGGFLVALLWALPHVERADLDLAPRAWWTILYLGVVPSGLAFFLWNRGATRVSVGVLAVMNNLKIPLAVAVALLPPFLEPFDAAALVLSSLLFGLALAVAAWPARAAGRAPEVSAT